MTLTLNKTSLCSTLLALITAASVASACSLAPLNPTGPDDKGAYAAGTRAMNEHRWRDAVLSFDQVVDARARNTDAALYWKAYSLNKLGNKPLALATCFQLRSQYKASSWNKDCSALSIDVNVPVDVDPRVNVVINDEGMSRPPRSGERGVEPGSDADLKILALNSLLNQDPARAIPLLRGLLAGNQPMNVKRHAIVVIAQSKSPEVQALLNDAVVGKMDPTLQREAIQMMAVFEGKRGNETLSEVYRTTSDREVKRSIISAFFITQDAPRMVEVARNEKDLNLKRSIVSQLALMHDKAATDYMLELLK